MNEEIKYFKGTHRVIAPSETIEINQDKLRTAGITRIADITDLDRIGLPIYTAIRPTAEEGAVSIYGGKGISKDHAKASAMMEGFERYSAEKQSSDKTICASIDEIKSKGNYIDPKSLNLPQKFKNTSGNANSDCHIATTSRLHRCYLRKLNLLLRLCHLEQPTLPFVVGLLTYTVFLAPYFYILSAVAAL